MLLRYLGCWPNEDEGPTSRADGGGSQDKARARQHKCSATAPTPTPTPTPPVRAAAAATSGGNPHCPNAADDLAVLAAAEQQEDEADEDEKKRQQHQHDHPHHPQNAAALLLLSPDPRHCATATDNTCNSSNSRSSTGGAYTALALSCAAIAASSSGGGSAGVDHHHHHQPQPSLPPPPLPPPPPPPPLRVAAAEPLPAEALTSASGLPWSQLRAAYSVGDLDFYGASSNGGGGGSGSGGGSAATPLPAAKTRSSSSDNNKKKTAVDVNSGGAVFVLVFAPEKGHNHKRERLAAERLAVLKLPACSGPLAGRLAAQAEALAAELAAAAGVPTPAARLLRRPSREWEAAMEAADGLLVSSAAGGRGRRSRLLSAGRLFAGSSSSGGGGGGTTSSSNSGGGGSSINPIPTPTTNTPSLSTELRHPSCPPIALLLEFCPGAPLNRAAAAAVAIASAAATAVARDAGAILALDLLLDNPDRFPMPRLGWRGNPGNVLVVGERLVAIDASVPRFRPGAAARRLLAATDAEAERVAQLACADASFARLVLKRTTTLVGDETATTTAALQNGLRSTLLGIESTVGLIETAERALRTSLRGFAEDALRALGGPMVVPSPSRPAGAAASSASSSSASSPLAQLRSQLAAGLRVEPCAAASPLAPTPACILADLASPPSSPPHQQQHAPPPPPPPPPPQPQPLTAAALAAIVAEARGGRSSPELSAVVAAWQERLRRDLEGLARAARDWAARRRRKRAEEEALAQPPPTTTWLLASYLQPYDQSTTTTSTTNSLADAHDLCSRLAHLLRRARLLASAALARQPDLVPLPLLPPTTTTTTRLPPPRLYIGDAVSADCAHVLRRLGVRRVLCCARELPWPPPAGGGLVAAARLALVDGAGWGRRGGQAAAAAAASPSSSSLLERQLDAAVEWIGEALEQAACEEGLEEEEEGGDGGRGATTTTPTSFSSSAAVLVHCSEGKSRSAAVVAAFLIARAGLSAAEALAVVRAARPCVAPHPSFVAALEGYDERRRRGAA
jgi:hypothetical protein